MPPVRLPQCTAASPWLDDLLRALPETRVAVFGDLCLDAYWDLQEGSTEVSLETGRIVRRVERTRYSPGGASNVAANLAALGVSHVRVVGLVGEDVFGDELLGQLAARGLDTTGVIRAPAPWHTWVYAKPYLGDEEQDRLDFGSRLPPAEAAREALLIQLAAAAEACPVVILNQQVDWPDGEAWCRSLNALIARHPGTRFLADSRGHAGRFAGAGLKLNAAESARLNPDTADLPLPERAAALAGLLDRPVMITRGEEGLVLAQDGAVCDVPGIDLPGPADPVGAGDAAMAGWAAALAAGAAAMDAACFANLAAAITTRKLRTTGTASPSELRALGPSPDYRWRPACAARLPAEGLTVEILTDPLPRGRIRHAIFDHDGTLSTLRQGWEAVMEPMMIRSILGKRLEGADEPTLATVRNAVRSFIDRTTGIQTLAQMKGLVDLVRSFGHVPAGEIKDEHGYKAVFNAELMRLVRRRRERLAAGELAPADFEIKGATGFLRQLHAAGVTLHLASGTDAADVAAEAQAMGYGDLFAGRIHGAVGDLRVEAKRQVIERIIREGGLGGESLAVFGDGPVEIREGRRHGALAIGVAADEVRRFDWDLRKRARVIRAGADLVITDYTHLWTILNPRF